MRIESKTGRAGVFFFFIATGIITNFRAAKKAFDLSDGKIHYKSGVKNSSGFEIFPFFLRLTKFCRSGKLIERRNNHNFIEKYPLKKRRVVVPRQPFWLPAASFYILASALAIAVFFLTWGILQDEEMPWITAGISSSLILAGAVVVREGIFRRARYRLLSAQEMLDKNVKNTYHQPLSLPDENKLTLEKNAEILKKIERKSQTADALGKVSENHREVFELCHEYLSRNEKELERVGNGSPRVPALRAGRDKIRRLHKAHLLAWSAAETRALIQNARTYVTISKKLESANKALAILDSALGFYPNEKELIESAAVVREFIVHVKVSHWIEQAERCAFKEDYKRAINHYRDALFYLARENVKSSERDSIAEKINLQIENIRKILDGKS